MNIAMSLLIWHAISFAQEVNCVPAGMSLSEAQLARPLFGVHYTAGNDPYFPGNQEDQEICASLEANPGAQLMCGLRKYPVMTTFLWYASTAFRFDEVSAQKNTAGCKVAFAKNPRIGWDPKYCGIEGMFLLAKERGVTIQLGYELQFTPSRLVKELQYGGVIKERVVSWAKELAASGVPIILRPMSEMNTSGNFWTVTDHASIESYVKAWKMLRKEFRENGARNVQFLFAPVVYGKKVVRESAIKKVLKRIGPEDIDAVGMNPYPHGPIDGVILRPNSLGEMIHAARALYKTAGFGKHPFMLGETGVISSFSSEQRREWFNDGYKFLTQYGVNGGVSPLTMLTIFDSGQVSGKYRSPPIVAKLATQNANLLRPPICFTDEGSGRDPAEKKSR